MKQILSKKSNSFKINFSFPPIRYTVAGTIRENSTIDLNKTTSSLFWQVLVMLDLWSVCGRNLPLRSTDTSASLLTTQTTTATILHEMQEYDFFCFVLALSKCVLAPQFSLSANSVPIHKTKNCTYVVPSRTNVLYHQIDCVTFSMVFLGKHCLARVCMFSRTRKIV